MGLICFHRCIENWREKSDVSVMNGILTPSELKIYKESAGNWNRRCSMSLFEFRHRIQEIHLKSIRVSGMKEVSDFEELMSTAADDDIIIPSDDDDFYHPDIASHLNVPDKGVLAWKFLGVTFGFRTIRPTTPTTDGCLISCGYAIKMKWLREIRPQKAREILMWHWTPHRMRAIMDIYTGDCLSFYNYHPATTSSLRYERYQFNPTAVWPRSRQFWVYPYMRDLYHVYEEAGLFRIKFT